PDWNPAEGKGVAGPDPSFIVVRQELGLVGGHVHVHRTIVLAPLARQAEIERVLDGFALPASGHHLAVHHFPEQPGPPAGGVLLLPRDHVAGTHGLMALPPALS